MNRISFFATVAALFSATKAINRPALVHNRIPNYVQKVVSEGVGATILVRKPMRFRPQRRDADFIMADLHSMQMEMIEKSINAARVSQ